MLNQFCLFVILISLILNNFIVVCSWRDSCKDLTSKSATLRLKNFLFCEYDNQVRPVSIKNAKTTTTIEIDIAPKLMEFDELSNTLSLYTWTILNWSDPLLNWNPKDYDGFTQLHVTTDDIWVPDIAVHNPGDFGDDQISAMTTQCELENTGAILCVPPLKYTTICETDYTNYPYDIQQCFIEIASWSYNSDEVTLNFRHRILWEDYSAHPEWTIIEAKAKREYHTYKMNEDATTTVCRMRFDLKRKALGIHVMYVTPATVLMVMTLSVLWLDSHSTERMIVACVGFVGHLICMQDLYLFIPHNGSKLPLLLKFYENSFLLMAFSLILTVLLRKLRSSTAPAPKWIISMTSSVLQSKVGQLLLLSVLDPKASAFLQMSADDNADLMHSEKRESAWSYVTLLISWCAFIIVFFTYLIMLALYLPSGKYLDKFPKWDF